MILKNGHTTAYTKELKMKKTVANQNGQGMLEYIILTGLVGIFCLAAFKTMGERLKTRVNHINNKIVNELVID